MKNLLITGTSLGLLLAGNLLYASDNSQTNKGCTKKANAIKQELVQAKKANNTYRVNGLEISLSKVETYCTDEGLIKDLKEKIQEKKEDLSEHTQDYNKAVKNERADKIEKYKAKIAEDNEDIQELNRQLKELS